MDGTVLDTLDDLADSVNHSLTHFGLPAVERDVVRQNLGNGADYLISHCVPEECDPAFVREILAYYKPWYDAHCLIKTKPYPGILPLMESLHAQGIRLGIISNKPDSPVQGLAERFFPGLLETGVGESPSVRRKPNPDTVLAAADKLGLSPSACVYVGDTEVDIETARRAGMDCIIVLWGFRSREQLLAAGAERIAENTEELAALL